MKKALIWLLAIVVALIFSSCGTSFPALEMDEVEKVTLWTHEGEIDIATEQDRQTVLDLYNASAYGGKATGEGGTPDFGIGVHLKNGDTIVLNQFFGKFEVYIPHKGAFYLENEAFYAYVSTMAEALLPSAE